MKKIFLLGIGGNTPVFIDIAEHCGYEVAGLYHYSDEKIGRMEYGFPVLDSFAGLFASDQLENRNFLLTMGDNMIRTTNARTLRGKGGLTPVLIHPTAVISRFVEIGTGVCISPFTYIQANSKIGADTIILSGVNISHNNILGEGCFVAGGAAIGAYTVVGDYVFIGQGVLTVSSKVSNIGTGAYVGAGSLITRSVEKYDVVAGRPAKSIKK